MDDAGLYAGFGNDDLHLPGNVLEVVMGRSGYVNGLLHGQPFTAYAGGKMHVIPQSGK